MMKYDEERDQRITAAEQLYADKKDSWNLEERISEEYFREMKVSIEWDIAWRIFDHVNEDNDTKTHIDLNCLDMQEACSISKQMIYEVAKTLKPQLKKPGFLDTLLCGMMAGNEDNY